MSIKYHSNNHYVITSYSIHYTKLSIAAGMRIARFEPVKDDFICVVQEILDDNRKPEANEISTPSTENLKALIDKSLNHNQKEELHQLLKQFNACFKADKQSATHQKKIQHQIRTASHPPVKHRPYRVSPMERRIIQEEVEKMLKNEVIQPSESPWSSPVVLVKKKDGTWRFCVDYRRLNKVTKKDVYPLPRIDDALDCIKDAQFFSSMDLQSGYWQIEVDEADREKTAFITPDGLYEFKVMPFGLCNAPATFERMMDNVLRGLKWNICLCYMDDVVVFSRTFEEHLRRLKSVLTCICNA